MKLYIIGMNAIQKNDFKNCKGHYFLFLVYFQKISYHENRKPYINQSKTFHLFLQFIEKLMIIFKTTYFKYKQHNLCVKLMHYLPKS